MSFFAEWMLHTIACQLPDDNRDNPLKAVEQTHFVTEDGHLMADRELPSNLITPITPDQVV